MMLAPRFSLRQQDTSTTRAGPLALEHAGLIPGHLATQTVACVLCALHAEERTSPRRRGDTGTHSTRAQGAETDRSTVTVRVRSRRTRPTECVHSTGATAAEPNHGERDGEDGDRGSQAGRGGEGVRQACIIDGRAASHCGDAAKPE